MIFSMVFLLIWGCDKEEVKPDMKVNHPETLSTNYLDLSPLEYKLNVVDGMVKFSDLEEYQQTLKYLRSGKVKDINGWIKSKGLVNLEAIYNNLYESIFNIEDENGVLNFIRENDKYISVEIDTEGEKEVVPKTDIFENVFANKDFIFMVGDYVYDVREHANNIIPSTLRGSCGSASYMEVYKDKDAGHCWRARRLKLSTQAIVDDMQAKHWHLHRVVIRGQRKWACIWINYDTALDFSNTPILESIYDGDTFDKPLTSVTGFLNCTQCYSLIFDTDMVEVNDIGFSPTITKVKAKATSRGIGNQFAEIDCD